LEAAQVDAPGLAAEVLLAHVSGLSRAQLLARPGQNVPSDALAHFDRLVERAATGEPLAYVIGHREFYALDFLIDSRALIPRPETELLVDVALKGLPDKAQVLDMGTGSGCIAVSLAVEAPTISVTALDIQAGALALAQQNAKRHKVTERLTFMRSDLFTILAPAHATFPQPFQLICANLPYIPTAELETLPVARFEPHAALDGGADGLALIRRFLQEASPWVARQGRVLMEIGATQGRSAFALAGAFFPKARVKLHKDLAGLDRMVEIQT
jgi:release factor glutamine methyltransferase